MTDLDVMASRLEAMRDKWLMATPDKTETSWAIVTQTIDGLKAAARERDAHRDHLVVLTSAVDEFATDFIMAHDASPDDSHLRLAAFREAVARLCGANLQARAALTQEPLQGGETLKGAAE